MHLMEKRYRDLIYTPGKLSQKQIDKIRRKYDAYKIVYKNGKVSGLPILWYVSRKHTSV